MYRKYILLILLALMLLSVVSTYSYFNQSYIEFKNQYAKNPGLQDNNIITTTTTSITTTISPGIVVIDKIKLVTGVTIANNSSVDPELGLVENLSLEVISKIEEYLDSKGYKLLQVLDAYRNNTSNELLVVVLYTNNTSISSLEELLYTFNKSLIEQNIYAALIPINSNLSILENKILLGRINVQIKSYLNSTNYTIIPSAPLIPPIIIPLPINVVDERNYTEGEMTVVLPVPTTTYWWFRAIIKGYLSTPVTGNVHAYTVHVGGIIGRRHPAIALRELGVDGEIVYVDGRCRCIIERPQIAIYTIKCDKVTLIEKITSEWLYQYQSYSVGHRGEAGGYATIGVYMPIGWWTVQVAAFNKGAYADMLWNGLVDTIWIG